jgi:hypothetical protein
MAVHHGPGPDIPLQVYFSSLYLSLMPVRLHGDTVLESVSETFGRHRVIVRQRCDRLHT